MVLVALAVVLIIRSRQYSSVFLICCVLFNCYKCKVRLVAAAVVVVVVVPEGVVVVVVVLVVIMAWLIY